MVEHLDLKELAKVYTPVICTATGARIMTLSSELTKQKYNALLKETEVLNLDFRRSFMNNNELKRLHIPMKRKGRRRTKRRAWYEL